MKIKRIAAMLMVTALCLIALTVNAFAAVNENLGAPTVSGYYDEATQSVVLTWEPVDGAASYLVSGCLYEELEWNLQDLGETTETTFIYAVEPGNKYIFSVNSWDAEGNVSPENSNDVIVDCPLPEPEAIAAPTVKASNNADTGKVQLTWNAVDGAKEYKVYRSETKNGSYSLMFTTANTSYTNGSSEVGKRYYYKVMAIAIEGKADSEYSSIVSRTRDLPRTEVTIANVASTGKIKLTWKAVTGAEGYQVYRSTKKNGSYTLMKTVDGTSYTNTSAKAGTKYFYKVRAIHSNKDAYSAYSVIKSRTCDLPKPVSLKVENSGAKSVKISWGKVSGAAKYQLYRSNSKNGSYKLIKTVTTKYATDTTVAPGKTYYYKVKAICSNTDGNSALSGYVTAKTFPASPVMKNSANATQESITVKWEKVAGASGYYVYRRSYSKDTWQVVAKVSSGTTSCKLSSKGKYVYKVKAYTTVDGEKYFSNYSNEIIARTMTERSMRVYNNNAKFYNTLNWKTTTTATAYEIWYKISSDGKWQLADTVPAKTNVERQSYDHYVNHGKSYYYRLRTIHQENGTTTYSKYGDTTRRQIIAHEADLTAVMSTKTVKSTNMTTITVTNNGVGAFTFYAEDAMWIDPDNKANCRDAVLYDYETYKNTGKLVKVSSVKVKRGQTVTLLIGVKGKNTRYDADTCIYLTSYYDGLNRESYISANSGAMVYKR